MATALGIQIPTPSRPVHGQSFHPATMLIWGEPVFGSARALDAGEPLSDEGAQEFRLLVRQGVSGVVDHSE